VLIISRQPRVKASREREFQSSGPRHLSAFSPNASVLTSGSRNNVIKLWEVGSGREIRTLGPHYPASMQQALDGYEDHGLSTVETNGQAFPLTEVR